MTKLTKSRASRGMEGRGSSASVTTRVALAVRTTFCTSATLVRRSVRTASWRPKRICIITRSGKPARVARQVNWSTDPALRHHASRSAPTGRSLARQLRSCGSHRAGSRLWAQRSQAMTAHRPKLGRGDAGENRASPSM